MRLIFVSRLAYEIMDRERNLALSLGYNAVQAFNMGHAAYMDAMTIAGLE